MTSGKARAGRSWIKDRGSTRVRSEGAKLLIEIRECSAKMNITVFF